MSRRHRGVDRAGVVQRLLVEPDVEVGAELVQRALDLVEHQPDADPAEHLVALGVGQVQRARLGRHDLLRRSSPM